MKGVSTWREFQLPTNHNPYPHPSPSIHSTGSSLNSNDSWRPRTPKVRRRRTISACSNASNISGTSSGTGGGGGGEKFFWQYNVQSKGPKTRRLALKVSNEDPHVLKEFQDPVLSGPLVRNQRVVSICLLILILTRELKRFLGLDGWF